MANVILLAGTEARFVAEGLMFMAEFIAARDHRLRIYARLSGMTSADLYKVLEQELDTNKRDVPTLLYYHGHGLLYRQGCPLGWSYDYPRYLEYKYIADLLGRYNFPILIINDCCYSESLRGVLEEAHVDSKRVGLLASANYQLESYGNIFTTKVLADWQRSKLHKAGWLREVIDVEKYSEYNYFMNSERSDKGFEERPQDQKPSFRFQTSIRWGAELDHYFYNLAR